MLVSFARRSLIFRCEFSRPCACMSCCPHHQLGLRSQCYPSNPETGALQGQVKLAIIGCGTGELMTLPVIMAALAYVECKKGRQP